MKANKIHTKIAIDGVRVTRVGRFVSAGRPMVRVHLADGDVREIHAGATVPGARPMRNELAAGPVKEGWYTTPRPRVRVTDGVWRGERGEGTRFEFRTIARAAAFAVR